MAGSGLVHCTFVAVFWTQADIRSMPGNSSVRSRTENSVLGRGDDDAAAGRNTVEAVPAWLASSPAAVPPAATMAAAARPSTVRALQPAARRPRTGRRPPPAPEPDAPAVRTLAVGSRGRETGP